MGDLSLIGPQELKTIVWQRLLDDGTLKRLNKKIKIALTSAVGEMRGTRDTQSVLDNRFKPKHKTELNALQTIYQYLEEHDLTCSLQCLIDETQVKKESDAFDLIQVLDLDEGSESVEREIIEEEEEEEESSED
jgi:hypothetical protein